MVKYSSATEPTLDAAAQAIASASRRAMVERLAAGPASLSELAAAAGLGLPATDKHVALLLRAGLVSKTKHGRTTTLTLNSGSLHDLALWAMRTRLLWSGLLDRYVAALTPPGGTEPADPTTPEAEPR